MAKPNIYLDIDGVLLANEQNLAYGALDFIKYLLANFDVYWLTSHCMNGDTSWAVEYVDNAADEDLVPLLRRVNPTIWHNFKTEAIDFSKPFVWFEDDLREEESAALEDKGFQDSVVLIDLHQDPHDLEKKFEQFKKQFDNI
jgi:hypothetical protein